MMCEEIIKGKETTLVDLRLGSIAGRPYKNTLGVNGAKALSTLLAHSSCLLTILDLRATHLYDVGLLALLRAPLKPTLLSLSLSHNILSSKSLSALVKLPSSLTHLDLSHNPQLLISTESHVEPIDLLLEALYHRCKFDAAISNISEYDSIATDEVLKKDTPTKEEGNALAMEGLDLSWTGIGKRGLEQVLKELRHNHDMKTLRVDGNRISEGGGSGGSSTWDFLEEFLINNSTLETLSMRGVCSLGEGGGADDQGLVAAVGRGLAKNVGLKEICLRQNRISGTGIREVAKALRSNLKSTLHTLDLSHNHLKDQGAAEFSAAL